jgi:hypothetical protein
MAFMENKIAAYHAGFIDSGLMPKFLMNE